MKMLDEVVWARRGVYADGRRLALQFGNLSKRFMSPEGIVTMPVEEFGRTFEDLCANLTSWGEEAAEVLKKHHEHHRHHEGN